MESPYKIRVKTLEGNILTFHNVNFYSLEEGLIKFTDAKTRQNKVFSVLNCEIEEEKPDEISKSS